MNAALVWAKWAPFHRARIDATRAMGSERGDVLHAIEIAGRQSDYAWEPSDAGTGLDRSLFRDADYFGLTTRQIRRRLFAALDEIRPDVVVLPGWSFRESLAGLAWCLRTRTARVVISDSQPVDTDPSLPRRWIKKSILHRFQAAFVAGRPHRRWLVELGFPAERCVLGCDVVDNDHFLARAPDPRAATVDRPPTLVSCLRLLPKKNVPAVLEALAGTAPEWSWVLAGDGPERPRVERLIRERGLSSRVELLGAVPYSRLPEVHARGDVYLQPSLSEPWGLTVNEAMASGLPVIVSDRCGCHEDLVEPGANGLVFDPGAPGGLADALGAMLDRRAAWPAMGMESRRIVQGWGLDRFARGFWEVCEVALAPGRTPEAAGGRTGAGG